jgi:hypothetical protein
VEFDPTTDIELVGDRGEAESERLSAAGDIRREERLGALDG